MRTLAVCKERCGFRAVVSTGWLDCTDEQAGAIRAKYGPLTRRVRRRGDRWQARVRLRRMACPKCGSTQGLERAFTTSELVDATVGTARRVPPLTPERPSRSPVFQRSTGWR